MVVCSNIESELYLKKLGMNRETSQVFWSGKSMHNYNMKNL